MGTRRRYVPWVLACLSAEMTGMSAAAVAARFGHHLFGDGGTPVQWLVVTVVVVSCLVQGLALGMLQARALSLRHVELPQHRMVRVSLTGTGIAWAAAVLPTLLAGHVEDGPPVWLVVLGAVGLGLVSGTLLGATQAFPARDVVTHHPWRWVAASTVTWPVATILVFLGTSVLDSGRPLLVVGGLALVMGVIGAAVLNIFSGAWLGTIGGQPVANRVSLAMVEGHRFGMDRRMVGLGVTGRRTGRVRQFPVQYADHAGALVVVPVRPGRKSWWRNIAATDTPIAVLDHEGWRLTTARVLVPGDKGHSAAEAAYRLRWPHVPLAGGQPVVLIARAAGGIPTVAERLESVG